MPRSKKELTLEKLVRTKDQSAKLRKAVGDNNAQAGRQMSAALDAGASRNEVRLVWRSSFSQIDRMVIRARAEKGGPH